MAAGDFSCVGNGTCTLDETITCSGTETKMVFTFKYIQVLTVQQRVVLLLEALTQICLLKIPQVNSTSTVDPPIPPLSGLAKSGCMGIGKGVIYNQEKTYSGLENQRRFWGEAVNREAMMGERLHY